MLVGRSEHLAARRDDARRARHALPALEAGQPGVEHVDTVLARERREQLAPVRDALERPVAARGRGPGEALGTMISRAPLSAAIVGMIACQASSQIRIAARPNGVGNTPRMPAAREEALLVEHAVGRQEHLAVDVHDLRPRRRRAGHVERAVVVRPASFSKNPQTMSTAAVPPAARHAASSRSAKACAPAARARRPRLRGSIRSSPLPGSTIRSGERRRRCSCAKTLAQRCEVPSGPLPRLRLDDRNVDALNGAAARPATARCCALAPPPSSRGGDGRGRRRSARRAPRRDRSRISAIVGCRCGIFTKSNTVAP